MATAATTAAGNVEEPNHMVTVRTREGTLVQVSIDLLHNNTALKLKWCGLPEDNTPIDMPQVSVKTLLFLHDWAAIKNLPEPSLSTETQKLIHQIGMADYAEFLLGIDFLGCQPLYKEMCKSMSELMPKDGQQWPREAHDVDGTAQAERQRIGSFVHSYCQNWNYKRWYF